MPEPTDSTPKTAAAANLQEKLKAYMQRKGLRSTAQRRLVTQLFFDSEEHFSIEELLALVRKTDPKVGYATVYRTLKLLEESGLAHVRFFGDGVSRYEVAHEDEHHDHLICIDCHRIVEFESEPIERLQETLVEERGFVIKRHIHELYVVGQLDTEGVCAHCGEKPKR